MASPAKAKVRLHLVFMGWECLRPPSHASIATLKRGDKIISQVFFPFSYTVSDTVVKFLNYSNSAIRAPGYYHRD